MFGFIRPVRPELRVREVDRFQQVYCGLCHAIRGRYGRFYTLFLSYDMTFYALVIGCGSTETPPPCGKRCDASPFRKKACAAPDEFLERAADVSVLLTYHKLRDSLADEKGAKRLLAKTLCHLGRKGYEQARARLPEADRRMVRALEDLQTLEQQNCDSMDRAADASARLTAAAVPQTGDARERILTQMFYHVGRWVYLLDACADVAEDLVSGNYNPVVRRYGLQAPALSEIKQPLETTLERSLVDVCSAFDLLRPERDEGLLRNIIFLGMPLVTRQVLDGTYQTNGGWGKHGSL
ncbi:DUF5685 family protein [Butyricicoccus faecihominis]|uniref:DUF5685 family protein n=1 Tax=Butyricicoccus faecihominis TaxID=1712515 RepID=UPI0024793A34|nr:DUF5685 family protein [Butyricicoccus faecihominis]MCQ5129665.1 DUF5685 family protein [Butyricicoccus faecihominis]